MKNIIVCGAGEVGRYASEVMTERGNNVTVIDLKVDKLAAIADHIDIRAVRGSSSHPTVLQEAGIANCDLLLAATDIDEVNLLTASLGKRMGCEKSVARVHHRAYFSQRFDYCSEFAIDRLVCPEQLTSMAITSKLSDPGVIEIQHFASNQIEIHKYSVQTASKAIGVKLSSLGLPKEMRLALVQRDGTAFSPDANTVFEKGDVVTLIGKHDAFESVQTLFSKKDRNNKVAILGGTSMGEWLARDLYSRQFSIRLFEPNKEKAIELSERYPYVTVIASDPTDPNEFAAEHLEQCAAFVTVTDNDEQNILGALQAKKLGVKMTAAVIHSPHFLPVLGNIGIDLPFSPRIVAAESLLTAIDGAHVYRLATLAPKIAEVFEVGPVDNKDSLGKPLQEITMPRGSFVAAIQRRNEAKVPGGDDRIESGDTLIIIGPHKVKKNLHRMFLK